MPVAVFKARSWNSMKEKKRSLIDNEKHPSELGLAEEAMWDRRKQRS